MMNRGKRAVLTKRARWNERMIERRAVQRLLRNTREVVRRLEHLDADILTKLIDALDVQIGNGWHREDRS